MSNFVSSSPTASLEHPNNVFNMQNEVSNNLNNFQIRYSRYLRCQNSNTANGVSDPPCDLNTVDSFSELTNAYTILHSSLDDIKTVYNKQTTNGGVTHAAYSSNKDELNQTYNNVIELQQSLDSKLKFIQDQLGDKYTLSQDTLNYQKMINLALITGVMCILYYIIFEI